VDWVLGIVDFGLWILDYVKRAVAWTRTGYELNGLINSRSSTTPDFEF
jgi:hypothetical protein